MYLFIGVLRRLVPNNQLVYKYQYIQTTIYRVIQHKLDESKQLFQIEIQYFGQTQTHSHCRFLWLFHLVFHLIERAWHHQGGPTPSFTQKIYFFGKRVWGPHDIATPFIFWLQEARYQDFHMKYCLFLYQQWFSQNLGEKARHILFMTTKMQIKVGLKKLNLYETQYFYSYPTCAG